MLITILISHNICMLKKRFTLGEALFNLASHLARLYLLNWEAITHQLLGSWPTIANAALIEGVCAAKMSRYVKAKTVIADYYYCNGGHASL